MEKKKIKVLVVLPWLPLEMSNGGNQAIYNGIASVAEDVELYITYYVRRKRKSRHQMIEPLSALLPTAHIFPYIDYMGKKAFFERLYEKINEKFFMSDADMEVSHMFDYMPKPEGYLQFINDLIVKYDIDIVQTEMLRNLSILVSCPRNVKRIFVHHELGYVRNQLFLEGRTENNYRTIAKIAKATEIGLLNECDAVVTLSRVDAQKLKDEGVKTNVYSSFSIVKDSEIDSVNVSNDCHILTFVGPESHAPNYIGLKWFLDNCWRRLLEIDSEYKLRIIGSWSDATKNALSAQYANIEALGFVPDLHEALKDTIMIVPITIGSGIRMKILEAANIGIPVVTTEVGVEGLPFEHSRDCYIAKNNLDFVDGILELKDKQVRERYIKNAHRVVKDKYSIDALKANRMNIYREVMGNI